MLLDDGSSGDETGGDSGAVLGNGEESLQEPSFKINEEYARRFEHNKRREELRQCTLQFRPQMIYSCL